MTCEWNPHNIPYILTNFSEIKVVRRGFQIKLELSEWFDEFHQHLMFKSLLLCYNLKYEELWQKICCQKKKCKPQKFLEIGLKGAD